MKPHLICIIACLLIINIINAQDRVTGNPDSAIIVTSDISNFWQAFDLLQKQHTFADSLHVIRTALIDKASEGLKQYMKAANFYENGYLEAIKKRENDYIAVRKKTETVTREKNLIVQYLQKFKQRYPPLKIPTICYTIGKFEVGGTQFEKTLYIGCETDVLHHVDIIAQSIHELAHFQQKEQQPTTNLDFAMIEGGAEFVCFEVTGKLTIDAAWKYGIPNETSLWKEFQPMLDSPVGKDWILDTYDSVKNRPGSLAYFIGFRICQAYMANHKNKKLALKEIIEMADPGKIFSKSLYEAR